MHKFLLIFCIFLFSSSSFAQNDDWTAYGKDSGGGHYSKATEITIDNVKNLKKVWTHRSGDYHQGNNWTEDESIFFSNFLHYQYLSQLL